MTQNKDVMEGQASDPCIIMRTIKTFTIDFYLLPCDENILHQIRKLIRWKPSPISFFKLDRNGPMLCNPSQADEAGMIRDNTMVVKLWGFGDSFNQ